MVGRILPAKNNPPKMFLASVFFCSLHATLPLPSVHSHRAQSSPQLDLWDQDYFRTHICDYMLYWHGKTKKTNSIQILAKPFLGLPEAHPQLTWKKAPNSWSLRYKHHAVGIKHRGADIASTRGPHQLQDSTHLQGLIHFPRHTLRTHPKHEWPPKRT